MAFIISVKISLAARNRYVLIGLLGFRSMRTGEGTGRVLNLSFVENYLLFQLLMWK